MMDLFKLHDDIEDRGAYSWIVVNGPRVFNNFKLLINKITEKSNWSIKRLSKEVSARTGCSTSMLYDIFNGRTKWISLLLISNLLVILKDFGAPEEATKLKTKFLNFIKFLKSTPRSPIKIKAVKTLSPELAEFCGIHAADGSLNLAIDIEAKKKKLLVEIKNNLQEKFPKLRISKIWKKRNKNKYGIYFYPAHQKRKEILEYLNKYKVGFTTSYKIEFVDSEKNSVEYLRKLITDLFGYEIKVKTGEGNWYYVLFSNKIIGRYLKNIFNFPLGKKSKIVEAPKLIKKAPFNIQKAFVRGLIQFDGSVKMKGTVNLSTNSKSLLDFFLKVIKRDNLRGVVWARKSRDYELGFESSPTQKWLTYFIKNTPKYQRLYEYIYDFTGRINSVEEAIQIFDTTFPQNNRSTLSLGGFIKMVSNLKAFTRYQISNKLNVHYKTIETMVGILERARIVEITRRKMLERFEGKSDKIIFNPNIEGWRVPQVSKMAEEAPMAYKDVDSVVEVVHNAGLSKKVVKLVPLAVIKGE